jgi:small subunit ribosomal protein S4
MSRYRESACRLCRVEKSKLFLKGSRCLSDKCSVERRAYPPGEHGRARRRILGYGIQLREKQKLKRYYAMSEKQFRLFFDRADSKKGITGETLLIMLERRLDNVIFISGLAYSRAHARQQITHGHYSINGRKATVPSILMNKGDVVAYRKKSAANKEYKAIVESNQSKHVPGWMQVDHDNMNVSILGFPSREDVPLSVEEHLVVELYSK